MSVAQTSLFAYRSIVKLGDKQEQVLNAIRELGKATNENLSDHLGWPINRVTGRVTELHRFGLIASEGLAMSKAGRPSKLWSARDVNEKKLLELANDCAD